MIRASIEDSDGKLATRLATEAERLARAALVSRRLADRRNPLRWRRARLLWPLFAKD